ncbi:sensor histidine kinase [Streptomyces xiamenensis]|uniref:ATP-binding protein n=1 Tax=Streptomyces xiamenensis TaxID=408015 RepID=UPI0036E1C8DF
MLVELAVAAAVAGTTGAGCATWVARRKAAQQETAQELVRDELLFLLDERLGIVGERVAYAQVEDPGMLRPQLDDAFVAEFTERLLVRVELMIRAEGHRVGESALSLLRAAAVDAQALSYRLQDVLAKAQEMPGQDTVLALLLEAARLNEQARRRWQIVGVLAGAGARLMRAPQHLPDIVTGAQSRVADGHLAKLQNHLGGPLGVVAEAAEPLAIIITELLANALYYSASTVGVPVAMHRSGAGVVIEVEDAGTGMHPDQQAFVERMLAGDGVTLADLGDPPRMGYAAIGRLARPLGITVTVGQSRYGGVSVVVGLPANRLVEMDEAVAPMSAASPLPIRRAQELELPVGGGMPQRRRKQPSPSQVQVAGPQQGASATHRSPEDAARLYSGFQAGSRRGRDGGRDEEQS